MPRREFDDEEVWEKLYAADENQLATGRIERSSTEGEDGEREFERRVLASVKGRDVIDIGCGTGEFTLEIAAATRTDSIREACRVLKKNGQLMLEEIGERDKQNWAQVFGRGQMYSRTNKVSTELKEKLAREGFRNISVDEFEAIEYFATIQDVLMRLENSPIIPNFDKEFDARHVQEIVKRFTASKGIKTNTHRVLITAVK
ncbi:hypothetical protein E6H24_02445 [Candidatus Bathyarchaeota archaeon]|nr:MAG: hypothetical protein E6H24_02445 [Candidatus Bathyarchaeota archaeon]